MLWFPLLERKREANQLFEGEGFSCGVFFGGGVVFSWPSLESSLTRVVVLERWRGVLDLVLEKLQIQDASGLSSLKQS